MDKGGETRRKGHECTGKKNQDLEIERPREGRQLLRKQGWGMKSPKG